MAPKYNTTNHNNFETREAIYDEDYVGCGDLNGAPCFRAEELNEFFRVWETAYKEKVNHALPNTKNVIIAESNEMEESIELLDENTKENYLNRRYFDSYGYINIHEDMIKDEVRTRSYYNAIKKNTHLFKDKIVLDIGSGTGILSFFAAKHGAKHVYSIEKSDIIYTAIKIRDTNNLTDKITFIKGLAENIELPVEKVDIIISEWMGYCLLYENMLDTVIYCRDKWLKDGGLIFPDKASMYIAGIEDSLYREEKFDFWTNCYGFDFRPVIPILKEEVVIDYVDKRFIVTDSCKILDLDLYKCTPEDLSFVTSFQLKMKRKDFIHALVIWFDIVFSACHTPESFTTGPYGALTHWKQIVLYTDDVITAEKNESVKGMFALKKSAKNPRHVEMKLRYDFNGKHMKTEKTQYFNIS